MVFRNEYGNLEFAFQAVWDAEGMIEILHRRYFNFALIRENIVLLLTWLFRPLNFIYEGKDEGFLFENGMLFNLVILIASI